MTDKIIVREENQNFEYLSDLIKTLGCRVRDLAKNGYFKNLKSYPKKSDFLDIVEVCKCCGKSDVKISAEEQMRKARDIYSKEDSRLYNLFKDLIFYEFNVSRNKGNVIFQLAWEDGHATGYEEVASYFEKYVDFVNDVNSTKEE